MQIFFYRWESVEIEFDDEFKIQMTDSLDNILNKIRWAFGEYPFTIADVIDSKTGEVILTVKK